MSPTEWYDECRSLLDGIAAASSGCADLDPRYEAVNLFVQDATRRINRADRDEPLWHHVASRRALFGLEMLLRETLFWVSRADELAEFNARHGIIHNYRFVLYSKEDDGAIDITSANLRQPAIKDACEVDLPKSGSALMGPATLGTVGAMAVFTLRYRGVRVSSGALPADAELRQRIELVASAAAGNAIPPELAAITEVARDTRLPAGERVRVVEVWLLTGRV